MAMARITNLYEYTNYEYWRIFEFTNLYIRNQFVIRIFVKHS